MSPATNAPPAERRVPPPPPPSLPEAAALAFAPLHKRAFGLACGAVGALLVAGVTAISLLFLGGDDTGIRLLGEYFRGYTVSWPGVLIGAFWGFITLFFFGWFAAFSRNFGLAVMVFLARTREELLQTRDFLDHI